MAITELYDQTTTLARRCGSCSLCCKLLPVPAIEKPGLQWCRHCALGKGCRIYPDRPDVCRKFQCTWISNPIQFGQHWWPREARMFAYADASSSSPLLFRIMVDDNALYRWRRRPWRSDLDVVSNAGLHGVPELFHTVACWRHRVWLIYPGGDYEVTDQAYVITEINHVWEVKIFPSYEEARDFQRGHLVSRQSGRS